jgi:cytochrome c peroxidase
MKWMVVTGMIAGAVICIYASPAESDPADKAELGRLLFFDPILSKDKTISCASCHKPAFAFADTAAVSTGVDGKRGVRNTPSAMNLRLQRSFFWDGRAKTLEQQALAPIENPVEMDLPVAEAVRRLQKSKTYSRYFQAIFKSEPTSSNLAEAIAAFERTQETSESPFDQWKFSGDSTAVSDAVKRGFALFNGKGKCNRCHFGADFTANEFRNIGLFNGKELKDSGRAVISGREEDVGKFKTAGLRNVAITSPYMHNGKFTTLEEVIEFYNDPTNIIPGNINRDTILAKPLGLTCTEQAELVAFLQALTDKRFDAGKKH